MKNQRCGMVVLKVPYRCNFCKQTPKVAPKGRINNKDYSLTTVLIQLSQKSIKSTVFISVLDLSKLLINKNRDMFRHSMAIIKRLKKLNFLRIAYMKGNRKEGKTFIKATSYLKMLNDCYT